MQTQIKRRLIPKDPEPRRQSFCGNHHGQKPGAYEPAHIYAPLVNPGSARQWTNNLF
jgi:hypothetical protein